MRTNQRVKKSLVRKIIRCSPRRGKYGLAAGPVIPANGACASAGLLSKAESDPEPAVLRPTGRGANKIGGASVSTVRVPSRGTPANYRRREEEELTGRVSKSGVFEEKIGHRDSRTNWLGLGSPSMQ